MILIWRVGDHVKVIKLTYAIIDPSILQAWVSLYTVLKTANLKSNQQHFLSKPPNIMFANTILLKQYVIVSAKRSMLACEFGLLFKV